jgi:hypothetical protein
MAFNQTSRPGLKKQIQGAKTLKTGSSSSYGSGSKVKGPDATAFGPGRMGGGGTTGGKSRTGAQYDTTSVSFNHGYSEGGAKAIVNSLHKK